MNNSILDLEPEQFELTLKELQLDESSEAFIRSEYANKNTLSGQMLGAFQGATEVPEGRERTQYAPMTKPEGMSAYEAFTSGEAELAFPGAATGAVEGTLQAVQTGEKMSQGLETAPEEISQAAQMGAGLGIAGIGTRLGKPFDSTVVSSGGAGPSATPYRPKLFRSVDEGGEPISPYSVAEFFSPTVETIKNTEFPSKGMTGGDLLKLLQDKTPGVRSAELSAMELGIDKQKRYTKEDVLNQAQRRSYKVTAQIEDNDTNEASQRQQIKDPEVSYSTIKINADPNSEDVAAFLPKRGFTHYDPNTIAHTRVSVREDQGGKEYMLVEEIQSDLLQNGALEPRGPISLNQAYDEVLSLTTEDIKQPDYKRAYEANKDYFDAVFKISAEQGRQYKLREKGLEVPQEDLDMVEALTQVARSEGDNFTLAQKTGVTPKVINDLYSTFENSGYTEGFRIDNRTRAVGKSPISEDSDAVRFTLQSAMAKANDEGVGSLVIPNIQRIITSGRARAGSEQYEQYMKSGSGFQKTYVKGVEKFIKQLRDQYGDAVKIEMIELPYENNKAYNLGKEIELPNTAIKIDFSGLKDVNFRVSRFAEGGLAEEEQMDKLMQEGGMADDGMSVEPVTGNEIPPGSLATEVRDDIDAQLSEGEYVVPADVVRFFGVKFFEDLRTRAKQGLSQMESDGRIGGATVTEDGIPVEGLSPEEQQMMEEALGSSGMAYGGDVQQPMVNAYAGQNLLYSNPVGMAEGGDVFDRTQFGGEDTFNRETFNPTESSGFETRRYIDPSTGESRSFQFLNGMAMGIVPPNFVPWSQELQDSVVKEVAPTPTAFQPVTNEAREGRGGNTAADRIAAGKTSGGEDFSYDSWAEKNAEAIKSDPYSFGIEALADTSGKTASKVLGGLGAFTGNPIFMAGGAGIKVANKVQNIAEANAARIEMEAQGLAGTPKYNNLVTAINSATEDLPNIVPEKIFGTGKKYTKALEDYTNKGTATTAPTAATVSSKGGTTRAGTSGGSSTQRDRDEASRAAAAQKEVKVQSKDLSFGKDTPKPSVQPSGAKLSYDKAVSKPTQSTKASDYSMGTPTSYDPSRATGGGRATGGLITKPEKTKTKGLGGKQ